MYWWSILQQTRKVVRLKANRAMNANQLASTLRSTCLLKYKSLESNWYFVIARLSKQIMNPSSKKRKRRGKVTWKGLLTAASPLCNPMSTPQLLSSPDLPLLYVPQGTIHRLRSIKTWNNTDIVFLKVSLTQNVLKPELDGDAE